MLLRTKRETPREVGAGKPLHHQPQPPGSSPLASDNRLAGRRPEERIRLEEALRGRLEELADVCLDVAVETGDPMGQVLAERAAGEASLALAEALMACGQPAPDRQGFLDGGESCSPIALEPMDVGEIHEVRGLGSEIDGRAELRQLAPHLGSLLVMQQRLLPVTESGKPARQVTVCPGEVDELGRGWTDGQVAVQPDQALAGHHGGQLAQGDDVAEAGLVAGLEQRLDEPRYGPLLDQSRHHLAHRVPGLHRHLEAPVRQLLQPPPQRLLHPKRFLRPAPRQAVEDGHREARVVHAFRGPSASSSSLAAPSPELRRLPGKLGRMDFTPAAAALARGCPAARESRCQGVT